MLTDRIIKLSALASKDITRSSLNGVWLSVDKLNLLLEVTDGHKASRETVENTIDLSFEGYFFVENEKIAMLKILSKQWGKNTTLPVIYDKATDMLNFGLNSELSLKRTQLKPPPFKQVYVRQDGKRTKVLEEGTEVPECTVIALDAKYLLEIAEALKGGKSTSVKLIIKDAHSPITVVCGQRDAVLMPCRV